MMTVNTHQADIYQNRTAPRFVCPVSLRVWPRRLRSHLPMKNKCTPKIHLSYSVDLLLICFSICPSCHLIKQVASFTIWNPQLEPKDHNSAMLSFLCVQYLEVMALPLQAIPTFFCSNISPLRWSRDRS